MRYIKHFLEKNADLSTFKKSKNIKLVYKNKGYLMAERMGFEPMIEFPLYTLSKRAPSATRPPLQFKLEFTVSNF